MIYVHVCNINSASTIHVIVYTYYTCTKPTNFHNCHLYVNSSIRTNYLGLHNW